MHAVDDKALIICRYTMRHCKPGLPDRTTLLSEYNMIRPICN